MQIWPTSEVVLITGSTIGSAPGWSCATISTPEGRPHIFGGFALAWLCGEGESGGPGEIRTHDLFHAMEARSQLRHRPTFELPTTATPPAELTTFRDGRAPNCATGPRFRLST